MNWQLYIANQARKSLLRSSKDSADRLLMALDEISNDPYGGDIRKVKGEVNTWRRRVGRYRITYEILVSDKAIKVTTIGMKSDNTY